MTGPEYRDLFKIKALDVQIFSDPMQPILDMGKRNLDWIQAINQTRSDAKKLQLSSAATQVATPIDQAHESNRTIIQSRLDDLKRALPQEMAKVVFGTGAFPLSPPIDDENFLNFARKVDSIYQAASRWLLEEPNLEAYTERSYMDIRGYYYLGKETNLDANLANWNGLDDATRANYTNWLVGQCHNARTSVSDCQTQLADSVASTGNAASFFLSTVNTAHEVYDAFFKIQNARHDVTWTAANPDLFLVPFATPDRPEVQAFLSSNIQDEWRIGTWNLKLDFGAAGMFKPHVTFVAGATPHVNGLGGNEITMDANRSLTEYSTEWTIRHEFGHVLGFPDCYVEFYDEAKGVMINYQIDIDNLMCSRRGHLHQNHLDELKSAYWHS